MASVFSSLSYYREYFISSFWLGNVLSLITGILQPCGHQNHNACGNETHLLLLTNCIQDWKKHFLMAAVSYSASSRYCQLFKFDDCPSFLSMGKNAAWNRVLIRCGAREIRKILLRWTLQLRLSIPSLLETLRTSLITWRKEFSRPPALIAQEIAIVLGRF